MFKEKITMIIMSCDKFSDLWDGHIKLLEKYWKDRDFNAFIVTDKESERRLQGVTLLAAGTDIEWPQRLRYALERVETEYVFFTLDDYFLNDFVSNEKMQNLLEIIQKDNYDYVRLYPRPKCQKDKRIEKYGDFYGIDTNARYSVNLFPGIWKKEILLKTTSQKMNIWEFEVSLSKTANSLGAKCAVSDNKEFPILDVVRQGKIQRKALPLLAENEIELKNRKVYSLLSEFGYKIKSWCARHFPKPIAKLVKKFLSLFGVKFFS